jgi:hypothetical protein
MSKFTSGLLPPVQEFPAQNGVQDRTEGPSDQVAQGFPETLIPWTAEVLRCFWRPLVRLSPGSARPSGRHRGQGALFLCVSPSSPSKTLPCTLRTRLPSTGPFHAFLPGLRNCNPIAIQRGAASGSEAYIRAAGSVAPRGRDRGARCGKEARATSSALRAVVALLPV